MRADPSRITAAAEQARVDAQAQRDLWSSGFTRRRFLAGAGMAAVAALGSQLVTTRYSYAAPGAGTGRSLVVVFLRGGFDGLGAVVPAADSNYLAARPSIGIPADALLPLDRQFGLHPALAPIYPFWKSGQLGLVQAVGCPDISRSHFQAQEQIERGVQSPGTHTGWLERVLEIAGPGTTFRAASEGVSAPMSLAGNSGVVTLQGLDSLVLERSSDRVSSALRGLFTGLDSPAADQTMLTLQLLTQAAQLQATPYQPGADYPEGGFGAAMADVARLIKSGTGLRVATVDVGGWDMHTHAGAFDRGDMTEHLTELGATLGAFAADLGDGLGDVTVVTMSEFGRRLAENGSGGTDHGHGNVMLLLGGAVAGGAVHGQWPGLASDALVQGDLAGVNDYRDVLAEISQAQLGLGSMTSVFPDHSYTRLGVAR